MTRRPERGERGERGFTLVETVIAMAILFGALVMAVAKVTADVNDTNKAKLLSAAIGLGRGKILDIEEELYQKGFQEMDEEMEGDFSDEGFPRYSWKAKIEKVELPSLGEMQTAQGQAAQGQESGAAGLVGLAGAGGGNATAAAGASTIASQFEMIANVLEVSIRKVTLEVSWPLGNKIESFVVVVYFTDPKGVDQAMAPINALSGAAGGGAGGGGDTGGGAGGGGGR